ncbi:MAG: membrane dipeptidase [Anaerolineaceae bacterium]|nr:membrane dipeptidase [Anaerolineaceae bacterium]
MTLIVDAHEDLADNMLVHARDYTRSAAETRRLEAQVPEDHRPESTLIGWDAYQRGEIAVVFSTLFAAPLRAQSNPNELAYSDYSQAHHMYMRQLDLYHRLTDDHPDQFRLIEKKPDLQAVLADWATPIAVREDTDDHRPNGHPVGLVVLMEGADGVQSPAELEEWWAGGVRIIGLAWAGTRYSGGTREPGPLTSEGRALIEAMADLGFTLDLSHMDPQAALQALERFPGTVIASHANPLGMLKGSDSNRHLPDAVVQGLIERGGVIGIVPYNRFLRYNWTQADGKNALTLNDVVAHIDYICQRAGDARHVGIGSDFDGGFGLPSVPAEIDTIADLQKLAPLLAEKGYSPADIEAIMGGNWLSILEKTLPR